MKETGGLSHFTTGLAFVDPVEGLVILTRTITNLTHSYLKYIYVNSYNEYQAIINNYKCIVIYILLPMILIII